MNNTHAYLLSLIIAISLCLKTSAQYDSHTQTINMAGYITNTSDNTPDLQRALADVRRYHAKRLVFPKGTYHFRPDSLKRAMTYISNNRNYMRCFAFDLTGMNNLEIDGQGSEFLFKGYVCPFYVNKTSGITLRNFTIDFERTFHSEGHIVEVAPSYIDVKFSKEYPYYVDSLQHLRFVDDEGTEYPWIYMMELDTRKKELAFGAGDIWTAGTIKTQDLGNGRVRVFRDNLKVSVGNAMGFGMAFRKVPGITVSDSKNFAIHNVAMYHAGGMGVIAQRSHNLSLDSFVVKPAPGKDRILSLGADATHFANCSGKIKMNGCYFSSQTDDATNIHGVYFRIADILPGNRIMVELVHIDQYGFGYLKKGLKVEFVNPYSLVTYGYGKVASAYAINDRKLMVTLSQPLPSAIKKGDVIAGCDQYPTVEIRNCYIGKNRARGLLLGSRAKTLVEGCTFHTSGTAIFLEGDAKAWFEQSGTRHVIIRHNTFENCNFANWNRGLIGCNSGISKEFYNQSYYNRNLIIEDNTFTLHHAPLLYLYSVDGVTFRNNRIIISDKDYPSDIDPNNPSKLFELTECKNVRIDPIKIETQQK